MRITFLGATQTVTGSKYLIETENTKLLIDCGLFEGYKELRLRNWAPLPIPISEIDAVILTHAHLDHSGYLPLLVKQGFRGKIYATPATRDLCSILLPDSGYLQVEEARWANKKGYSKHKPALPLYTQQDAENVMKYFETVDYEQEVQLDDALSFRFSLSGHILGSAFILLKNGDRTILFSGDIGRYKHPFMKPPSNMVGADYLVVESTYGDREHDPAEPLDQLTDIIQRTVARQGTIVIPAFTVGRTQTLLLDLYKLISRHRIPALPIYLDSPMAIKVTDVFCKYYTELRLTLEQCQEVCRVAHYVDTVEESKSLLLKTEPKIILSASGMATGGRILHHIKKFLPDARNTVLFTGYQAAGTRGDRLVSGEKRIKIHGEWVAVNAEICAVNTMSAHADYHEILMWLQYMTVTPKKVFITHGELPASESLQTRIEHQFHWKCFIPTYCYSEKL